MITLAYYFYGSYFFIYAKILRDNCDYYRLHLTSANADLIPCCVLPKINIFVFSQCFAITVANDRFDKHVSE